MFIAAHLLWTILPDSWWKMIYGVCEAEILLSRRCENIVVALLLDLRNLVEWDTVSARIMLELQ